MNLTKQLVKTILENAGAFKWSLQGLGMLRLYLSTEVRLHIWDSRYAVPNVSTMHDHPWSFDSLIVAGWVNQYRYTLDLHGEDFLFSVLQCGPGGCAKTQPTAVRLRKGRCESYQEGQTYRQRHDEIHQSIPEDGTVTLVTRTFREDTEHARVFWPNGTAWVSAEPRPATPAEVQEITGHALNRWFTKEGDRQCNTR
jgi:hypothetical protein